MLFFAITFPRLSSWKPTGLSQAHMTRPSQDTWIWSCTSVTSGATLLRATYPVAGIFSLGRHHQNIDPFQIVHGVY